MESTLSTLAELAANLLKLERRAENTSLDTAARDAMEREELMSFAHTTEPESPIFTPFIITPSRPVAA